MAFGIIVIDKNGVISKKQLNSVEQLSEIYKKCSTSRNASASEYPKLTTWEFSEEGQKFYIDLYGKKTGRAGFENKYDLPPPVDKTLLFNSFALVKYTKTNTDIHLKSLTPEMWKNHYETLFGGFEDLKSEEASEDELENVPEKYKTADGYLKDDFVADNNEIENEESDYDSDVDEEDAESSDNDKEDGETPSDVKSEADDSEDIEFEDDDAELTHEEYEESDNES